LTRPLQTGENNENLMGYLKIENPEPDDFLAFENALIGTYYNTKVCIL
jgi:hypothetical protein